MVWPALDAATADEPCSSVVEGAHWNDEETAQFGQAADLDV